MEHKTSVSNLYEKIMKINTSTEVALDSNTELILAASSEVDELIRQQLTHAVPLVKDKQHPDDK